MLAKNSASTVCACYLILTLYCFYYLIHHSMRLCMMCALKGKIHRKWQIGCHFFSLSLMLFMHQIACLEAIKWFANCGKIDAPQNTPVVTWIKTLSTIISKTSLISFWRSSFHHSQITQQALGNLETKSDHIGIPSVIFIHSWYQISRSIWYFQVMFHNHKPIYSKA